MTFKPLVLATLLLLGSQPSLTLAATDIGSDMDTLAENYTVALNTQSLEEFKASLKNMRAAALDAQNGTPPRLYGKQADSAEMMDFRHGLQQLVDAIDRSLSEADKGNLLQAQNSALQLKPLRDRYHQKYR